MITKDKTTITISRPILKELEDLKVHPMQPIEEVILELLNYGDELKRDRK